MLSRFVPTDIIARLRQPRGIVVGGALLVLLSLLANNAGLAIVISALVVPLAVLIDLKGRNLFDVEPWWALVSMTTAGAVAAVFITLLNILLLKQFEHETDPFSRCCGVFLGRVNLNIPEAGGVSVIAVGVVLPIVAAILMAAGPLYLKQQPRFSNEVMDGVTLGAAAGGGFAAASTILYFWPLVNGSSGLGGSVSGWTSALIALLIVRPLIFCAITALLCAGLWQYSVQPHPGAIAVPAGSALIGTVVLAVGSLALTGNATVVELLWNVALLIALLAASRYVLRRAIGQDRRNLRASRAVSASAPIPAPAPASEPERIICPVCGAATRPGAFCTNCGTSLTNVDQLTEPLPRIIEVPTLQPDAATATPATTAAPIYPVETESTQSTTGASDSADTLARSRDSAETG